MAKNKTPKTQLPLITASKKKLPFRNQTGRHRNIQECAATTRKKSLGTITC